MNLTRDHLVAEADDNVREQLEAVCSLVRDQDAKVLCPVHSSTPKSGTCQELGQAH